MYCYTYNLRGLYETPVLPREGLGQGYSSAEADGIVQAARQAGRTLLTELESKQVLACYGIPTVPTFVAAGEAEAVERAGTLGYPVVLKLHSRTLTHKTDVGGVQLNLADAASVRRAYRAIEASVQDRAGAGHFDGVTVQPMPRTDGYELILGSSIDPQFGPVLLFGTGGRLAEVFQDRALALPPLTTTLARRMMEQTRIFTALKGARGRKPVDLAALEQLLVRFSHLVVEQRWIREIDVNPLLATSEQFLALGARMFLHGQEVQEDRLPRLAIRPYPVHYTWPWTLKDGTAAVIRPIRPEDETLMVKFHETLSEQSVYQRYFRALKLSQLVAHERLSRLCFIDYDREMALVADREDPQSGRHAIIAIGPLIKMRGSDEAEAAVLVSDRYQRNGLGTEMVRRLVQIGRDEKLRRIRLLILRDNTGMQWICEKLQAQLHRPLDDSPVEAVVTL
jgi:acetyltransferase